MPNESSGDGGPATKQGSSAHDRDLLITYAIAVCVVVAILVATVVVYGNG